MYTAHGSLLRTVEEEMSKCGAAIFTRPSAGPDELDGVVVDASDLYLGNASKLWDTFKQAAERVKRAGRIVVLTRNDAASPLSSSGMSRACLGFVKSAAKELGGKGVGVNALAVPTAKANEAGLGPISGLTAPLSFLLSPDSAFVSGQELAPKSVRVGDGSKRPVNPDPHALFGKVL